jgi:hypothetical protein
VKLLSEITRLLISVSARRDISSMPQKFLIDSLLISIPKITFSAKQLHFSEVFYQIKVGGHGM